MLLFDSGRAVSILCAALVIPVNLLCWITGHRCRSRSGAAQTNRSTLVPLCRMLRRPTLHLALSDANR